MSITDTITQIVKIYAPVGIKQIFPYVRQMKFNGKNASESEITKVADDLSYDDQCPLRKIWNGKLFVYEMRNQ